ncbi:MAG TPA: acyltransferase domain-containing protein, partial [Blastocatellia bacterium]
ACVAGVFSFEHGLMLVRERARLMQLLKNAGAMASVFAEKEKVSQFVERYADELSIAAINGPKQTVISGSPEALKNVLSDLNSAGINGQSLAVSHGFHSPLMRPMLGEFSQAARSVKYEKAKIGVVSNVTGKVSFDEVASADYWCRHILAPVDFAGGMNCLNDLGCEALIEVGPKPTMLSMGKHCIPNEGKLWLPSLLANRPNWAILLDSLASLYVRGAAVDWVGFDRDYARRRVHLPTYPFQRRRCWIEAGAGAHEKAHPLLGRRLPELANLSGTHVWEAELNYHSQPYLTGHQIFGSPVLAYAIYVEMALASAREAFGAAFSQVVELELHHPVFIREDETVTLQLVLSEEFDRSLMFRAYNRATRFDAVDQGWTLCASAKVQSDGAPYEVRTDVLCQH